jgi:hypothetical protein
MKNDTAQQIRDARESARIRAWANAEAYAQDPNGDGDGGRDYFSESANSEMGQDE